jgi:glutathione-regulated potassium-efflux system ancillary protein KefG
MGLEGISMSVLVLLAHPNAPPSRVNAALSSAARGIDGVTVHDLYDAYPHFFIDVAREQGLVEAHHTLVMQHPMYWYGVPALLKQWMDATLTDGWAYGHGAAATAGKRWAHAVSTAGSAHSYSGQVDPADDPSGRANYFSLDDYMKPYLQSARLCGMRWHAPFAVHSAETLGADGLEGACERYRTWLQRLLADGRD